MSDETQTAVRTRRVLVLGRDIRAFLTVIRSLGRAGLEVHVGMCPPDDLALRSKYVSEYHEIPEYRHDSGDWLESVRDLAERYRYDLIIPTHDESAIPVQIHRAELAGLAGVYGLDDAVFEVAFDKIRSSLLVEKLGIRVPRQVVVAAQDLLSGAPPGFEYPLVLKPPSSYVAEDLSKRHEVAVASGAAHLLDVAGRITDWGDVLVQELFEGVGTGVEVLAQRGRVLAAFQHLRVHEPLSGGASSYRRSVAPIFPDLLVATEKLIEALDYTGVAMVEYKYQPSSGDWIFIEINGRFWGSLPLAVASGADFPRWLYDLLVNGTEPKFRGARDAVYARNLQRDLYWAIDNLRDRLSGRRSPGSVPVGQMVVEYFRLLTFREHVDSFAADDPRPGLAELANVAGVVGSKIRSVAGRQWRAMPWSRGRRAEEIVRRARRAKHVAFVCSGNICRSPFAERYARQRLAGTADFVSTGFHQEAGRPAPAQAVETAADFGVELADHRSSVIDRELVERSDLIFVFEEKHMRRLLEAHPECQDRTRFLGDLLTEPQYEIADPYGGDAARFVQAYRSIAMAIERLVP